MEEKKKSNAGLIIFLIIIIIGLAGYICYDKFFNKKETPKTEEKDENYDAFYPILNERMPRTMCYEFSELYQESGFKVSEMSQKIMFLWTFKNIHNEVETMYSIGEINGIISGLILNGGTVTLNEIKANSIFDTNEDYEWGSIANISYTIIDDNTIKARNTVMDCEPTSAYLKKIVGRTETADKLELKVKVAFVEEEDLGVGEWYGKKASDAAKYPDMKFNEHAVETFKSGENGIKESDLNWDLYDTYTITFLKDNGTYYFDNIKLDK